MNSLQEYSEIFQKLNLTEMSVSEGDFHLCMKKEQTIMPAVQGPVQTAVQKASGDGSEPPAAWNDADNLEQVKAPLLGIFYAGTEDSPFVRVGDRVHKGEVLCTIEAMKMFNEVAAPADGIIREILVKDGDLVEYNQPLFRMEKQSLQNGK